MRIRRGALPAAMIGLVGVSFSLVVAGGASYAAALPSLFDAAYTTPKDSLFHTVEAALPKSVTDSFPSATGRPGNGGSANTYPVMPSNQGGPAVVLNVPFGSGRPEEGDENVPAGQLAIGGLTFASPFTPPEELQHKDESKEDAQPEQPSEQGKPVEKPQSPAPAPQHNGGGSAPAPAPQPDPGAPQPPELPPDHDEQERKYREAIIASYNRVSGYLARANEVGRAFASDCGKASIEQQNADAAKASRLQLEANDEYMAIRDYSPHPLNSRYDETAGRVIGMYRTLSEYAGYYYNAWMESLDPLGTPERLNAHLEKANRAMIEFNSYYQGFTI